MLLFLVGWKACPMHQSTWQKQGCFSFLNFDAFHGDLSSKHNIAYFHAYLQEGVSSRTWFSCWWNAERWFMGCLYELWHGNLCRVMCRQISNFKGGPGIDCNAFWVCDSFLFYYVKILTSGFHAGWLRCSELWARYCCQGQQCLWMGNCSGWISLHITAWIFRLIITNKSYIYLNLQVEVSGGGGNHRLL